MVGVGVEVELERRSRHGARRRGSAMVVVMFVVMSLMVTAFVATQISVTRSQGTAAERESARALWAAEAGIGMKALQLRQTQGAATDAVSYTLQDGTQVTVTVTDVNGFLRLNSTATASPGTRDQVAHQVEVFISPEFHPVFYKAVYVGNHGGIAGYKLNFGPNVAQNVGGASWVESTWRDRNTKMSEVTYGIDFNNDGDFYDEPTLGEIHSNRVAWGWNGYTASSGNNRRLDINKNGSFETSAVTTPTQVINPAVRDPALDSPTPVVDPNYDSALKTDDADYIEGKVYVNGDIDIKGKTNIFGEVDATGTSNGDPVGSVSNDNVPAIPAPDLASMDYDSIADVIVRNSDPSVPSYMTKKNSSSYYGDQLGPSSAHDNPYFHLKSTLNFQSDGSGGKLILVKGNLWLHDTSSLFINMPANQTQRVTVVVEGNLYIADDLQYNNANSAVLFIVKGNDANPESYVDTNRNYRYDPGEPILNDNGNGVYEGPKEGQGNVFFGDPRFGTGGVTDGYIYAQNNVYLVNPPNNQGVVGGQDAVFGVFGFLSAGGIMDLGNRTGGQYYNNYRVRYDPRLADGQLSFKGMPRGLGGGWNQAAVKAWRQVH